jgi:hypothetical protein
MKSKNILIFILSILLNLNFVSAQSAKKPSLNQQIRNKVINETKSSLALPKYFKLEKVSVTLNEKSKINTYEVGDKEIKLEDLFNKDLKPNPISNVKYFNLLESDEYNERTEKFHKIDSIVKDDTGYFFYYNEGEAIYLTKDDSEIQLYSSSKKIKYTSNSWYTTEIYYWAMSNGGSLRLYHDEGLVGVNKNGKISYSVIDDE